jgi:hypothetical protein
MLLFNVGSYFTLYFPETQSTLLPVESFGCEARYFGLMEGQGRRESGIKLLRKYLGLNQIT